MTEGNISEPAGVNFKIQGGIIMSRLDGKMAKKILASRKDRILAIPEGITELTDDFALQFDERDAKYYFFQIDIPASVEKIEFIELTEEPVWASESRLECFDEITVASENRNFCSVDGVLFSKDMETLIFYPCGKREETYIVPDGVKKIENSAFSYNHFLSRVILPETLKSIGATAFYNCWKLTRVDMPEGLQYVGENAFASCNIFHMALPSGLKAVHYTNLIGGSAGIWNLEIPDSSFQIDMSGCDPNYLEPYTPPLLLVNDNPEVEKFARRYYKNICKGYIKDDSGIVWSSDKSTLFAFPPEWPEEKYILPEHVKSVFRWAFNLSDVRQVVSHNRVKIVGETRGEDYSRLASENDYRYEQDFLVVRREDEMSQ